MLSELFWRGDEVVHRFPVALTSLVKYGLFVDEVSLLYKMLLEPLYDLVVIFRILATHACSDIEVKQNSALSLMEYVDKSRDLHCSGFVFQTCI